MQGPESTRALEATLRRLSSRRHESLRAAFLDVAGPFPLAGPAHWMNDWHAYRPCPYPHVHEGVDLVAPRGTPIVAVAPAVVTEVVVDPTMSGLGIEITASNGVSYFYAHMERFAPNMRDGLRVRTGLVIGFVGNTGDAAGGVTHLHFEVQPAGVPVPPKPYVDRWLLRAEAKARRLLHAAGKSRHGAADRHRIGARTGPALGTVLAAPTTEAVLATPVVTRRRPPIPNTAGPRPSTMAPAAALVSAVVLVAGAAYARRRATRSRQRSAVRARLEDLDRELLQTGSER